MIIKPPLQVTFLDPLSETRFEGFSASIGNLERWVDDQKLRTEISTAHPNQVPVPISGIAGTQRSTFRQHSRAPRLFQNRARLGAQGPRILARVKGNA
jgi:hypothetical protein